MRGLVRLPERGVPWRGYWPRLNAGELAALRIISGVHDLPLRELVRTLSIHRARMQRAGRRRRSVG